MWASGAALPELRAEAQEYGTWAQLFHGTWDLPRSGV